MSKHISGSSQKPTSLLTFGIVETEVLHSQSHGPVDQLGQVLVLDGVFAQNDRQMIWVLLQLSPVTLQQLQRGLGGATLPAEKCVQP